MEGLSWLKKQSGARVVVYVDIHPQRTVSWRVPRDAELRIGEGRVWLTRHQESYDYFLMPGDVVRLSRGERVWISADGEHKVEVSLTSYRKPVQRWFTRWLIPNAI
ncbi:DUF2917 domain-containing protein [Caballeronia sp. BR00000012568055]|uniref:DUF2917 domain-containing protein n=1 Tax=Caballeronia sp. BR00000012568055 TaxID=2918761 RepID=UPI0023F6E045|nr:DUF2917 domain-containing protein [Caballeronia sp. BR00000012568055]